MFNQELARALSKEDVDVTIVAPSLRLKDDIYWEDSVRVCRLASPNIPPKYEIFQMYAYKKLAKLIRKLDPDIINVIYGSIMPPLPHGCKVVATVHGSPAYSSIRLHLGLDEVLRERISRAASLIPKILFPNGSLPVEKFVYVSKTAFQETLTALPAKEVSDHKDKSEVIYQGVDAAGLRKIVADALPYEDDKITRIMFMGRITKYKGLMQMLPAFKIVLKEAGNVRLEVFGDGPLWGEAVNQVRRLGLSKAVFLHGVVPKQELLRVLSSSYLVVHPSLVEAGCMVGLEAFSFGKPLVAHAAPWSREFVKETETGLIASVFEPKKFAEAILTLLSDASLYRKLSSNAIEAVEKRFNCSVMARSYLQLYRKILEGH